MVNHSNEDEIDRGRGGNRGSESVKGPPCLLKGSEVLRRPLCVLRGARPSLHPQALGRQVVGVGAQAARVAGYEALGHADKVHDADGRRQVLVDLRGHLQTLRVSARASGARRIVRRAERGVRRCCCIPNVSQPWQSSGRLASRGFLLKDSAHVRIVFPLFFIHLQLGVHNSGDGAHALLCRGGEPGRHQRAAVPFFAE